ncbi:MAG: calcium-binding protein [Synechococcus sp.]
MSTLYKASTDKPPSQQGWLEFGASLQGSEALTPPHGTLLTSSMFGVAGYSNHSKASPVLINSGFPALDQTLGFKLDFRLRIISESHNNAINRAGFSVIILDHSVIPKGIELGFWANSIFSQAGGSKPFQAVADRINGVNTNLATNYSLRILNDNYFLFGNNKLLLSGALQTYGLFPNPPGSPYNPYMTKDFLFLGDNTSSASANVELGSIAVNTMTAGTNGSDSFTGTNQEDSFNGLTGDDVMNGGGGDDWLNGGLGTDTLNGGLGNDFLIGGAGSDKFHFGFGAIFNVSLGIDTIADFNSSDLDRIVLSHATFTALPAGATLKLEDFAVVSSNSLASSCAAKIVYNSNNGTLFYNPNGSAPGFSSVSNGGGAFAQLWNGKTGTPFPIVACSSFVLA